MDVPTRSRRRTGAAPGWPQTLEATVVLDEQRLVHGLGELRHELAELVRGGPRRLVVDVSRIERMSSTTVAVLLWAQRTCRARGGSVVLRAPTPRTRDLLARTGLRDMLAFEEPDRHLPPPGRAGAQ